MKVNQVVYMASVLACLLSTGIAQAQENKTSKSAPHKMQLAEFAITNFYVDDVDEDKLVEGAIVRMLEQLDPHSTYLNAEEVKKMNEPLQGNFEGVGIQFNMAEDTLLVIQPVSGGPSEKAGILAGDRIVMVDDTLVAGVKMSTEDIQRRLRGPKDTKVNVKVLRRGVTELLDFNVKRDNIPVYSLDAAYLIREKTGYIRINRFGATTHEEFKKALADLRREGMKDLILDLQGNGGGYLNAAIDIANEFLEKGELIVYTEGRRNPRSDFFAKGTGVFREGRLVVLVDEFSASASEIVTGAVQDWDRGLIVGRRSFGKGLVQRPVDLPDGSMIRLTVARYYTPAGRCIQKPYEDIGKYNADLIERYNKGEMMSADSIHFPDSLKFRTHKLKRIVYGGGGIMPDYFVPVDTARYTPYHRNLRNKGALMAHHYHLMDTHRKEWLDTYQTFDEFYERFEITPPLLDGLVATGTEMGVEFDAEEYEKALPLLKLQMKALIARDLWNTKEYYHVINQANESIQKALELLEQPDFEALLQKELQEQAD